MMKKLLALLVALMLPAAALAQASRIEWMLTVDEERCTQIYASSGLFGEDEKLIAALAKIMNGLGVRVTTQENGGAAELVVGGKTLLDFTALQHDDLLVITSTLVPGYGLTLPVEELSAEDAQMQELLVKADLRHMAASVTRALTETAQRIEVSTTRGSFAGDAYSGGVYCTTIELDDSDVAALLSCVMTEDVRALTASFLTAMELDAESLLEQLDALHQRVAEENEYRYILRLVSDEHEQPIGGSAVVLRGGEQLATVSVGVGESDVRIVFGSGVGEENYWLDIVVVADPAQEDALLSLTGTMLEFFAPKDEDFHMAAAVAREFAARTVWSLNVSPYQNGMTWSFTQTTSSQGGMTEKITCSGMTIGEDTLVCSVKFALNGEEYMTLSISRRPCEPVSADHSSLTLCDISDEGMAQEALLEEIGEQLGLNLVMRLLQVLPMDLLTTFLYN